MPSYTPCTWASIAWLCPRALLGSDNRPASCGRGTSRRPASAPSDRRTGKCSSLPRIALCCSYPTTTQWYHQQSPCCDHSSCHCREAELQERELQYRSIFEATSDGLEISDIDGCIVQANAALCTMYGYTYAEMIGLDFRRLVDSDQLHDVPGYRAAVSRGETFVRQGN